MSEKLLVTGGGGLLGNALKKLLPEALFLTRADGDLTDAATALQLFEDIQPAKVLHLAACVAGVKANAQRNADLYRSNALLNINVLTAAQKTGVSALVSVLSSCAYETYPDRPSCETDLHVGLPFSGNLGYGYSKRMLDIHTRLLWEQHGCRFTTITPVTMYGPHDNFDLEQGHVVASLVHRCYQAKQRNEPLLVWGSGNAVRQFAYCDDIAKFLILTLENIKTPETLIVAADEGIKIRDLAHLIAKSMDFQGDIIFDKDKPEGQLVKVIKSRKFDDLHGDFKFTAIDEGLANTVKWFAAHYDEARKSKSPIDPS